MANLRGVGRGLEAMAGILQDHFARVQQQQLLQQRADAAQQAEADRQEQDKASTLSNEITMQALKDPTFGARASDAGLLPGMDRPSDDALAAPINKTIADTKTPNDLMTLTGMLNAERGGGMSPFTQIGGNNQGLSPATLRLLGSLNEKKSQLQGNDTLDINSVNPATGLKQTQVLPRSQAVANGPFQAEATPQQVGANKAATTVAEHTPEADQAEANAAGLKAGTEASARSKAEFPWQLRLAQTRANTQLLNAQAMDQYKQEHPHATANELNRASTARVALATIADDRAMLDEMAKRGMLGAIRGRASELAAGKIKSESLFANPDDAHLAAQFFSNMGLTESIAAVAHGGARGGGSPQMHAIFRGIINGFGDPSMTAGQLDAVQRIMERYAKDPTHQIPDSELLKIPGLNLSAPAPGTGNSALDSALAKKRALLGGGS